jgi:His-Xaa-Ser repeat protein HxsA
VARKGKFAIPTLLAAGLTPFAAAGDEQARAVTATDDSFFDGLKKIVSSIGDAHKFTLAQHRSHGSHGSHSSHRSSAIRLAPGDAQVMTASASTRNEMSTPPTSLLPSTPAITKKLKVLPGNSGKFRELVTQAQIALLVRGYEVGEVNGELHARTVAALYRYQADRGLVPSGKLTNEVLSSLGIAAL